MHAGNQPQDEEHDQHETKQRIGRKKTKIAVARKIAVILHCIWTDGTESTGVTQRYEQPIDPENRFGGTSVPAGTMVAAISKFVPAGIAPRSSH